MITRCRKLKKWLFLLPVVLLGFSLIGLQITGEEKAEKKNKHPFDLYNHEMHTPLFESANVACDRCHADPDSYGNRKKVNPQGCHICHRDANPPLPASQECSRCHEGGIPKPISHKVDWKNKHQVYAKQDPKACLQCHKNEMFCIDCHRRRDTVQERMHRRNFKFFHSIEARANPRKCDACHTVNYCQQCHIGRNNSSK